MDRPLRVYVAGSRTLIGSAVAALFARERGAEVVDPDGSKVDLSDRQSIEAFFESARPDWVVHAAGLSGGIGANQRRPAELAYDNLTVTVNLLEAAHRQGVGRLLYLASSCCYPRDCRQPMRVEDLWSGPVEPTNEAYAAAKLAGIALCRAYRCQYGADFRVGIPANAFGPGDDLDAENAHVIAALMVRMDEARRRGDARVTVWGSGRPTREFIFADDLARACLVVLACDECPAVINLGGNQETSIADLAEHVRQAVGYQGRIEFDTSRPDGMPRKALDSGPLAAMGFRPGTPLDEALAATYRWYLSVARAPGAVHAG